MVIVLVARLRNDRRIYAYIQFKRRLSVGRCLADREEGIRHYLAAWPLVALALGRK